MREQILAKKAAKRKQQIGGQLSCQPQTTAAVAAAPSKKPAVPGGTTPKTTPTTMVPPSAVTKTKLVTTSGSSNEKTTVTATKSKVNINAQQVSVKNAAPHGNKPSGNALHGNKPSGNAPHSNKPSGNAPHGNKPSIVKSAIRNAASLSQNVPQKIGTVVAGQRKLPVTNTLVSYVLTLFSNKFFLKMMSLKKKMSKNPIKKKCPQISLKLKLSPI